MDASTKNVAGPNDYSARLPPTMSVPTLTFYGSRGTPNPRRVEIFMLEHGLAEGRDYKYVDVNIMKQEHKRGGKYETPNRKVPMLIVESDPDPVAGETGVLAETVAICRYIEERLVNASNVCLFGSKPLERAKIEMVNRRIEFELLSGGVGKSWVHGPMMKPKRLATNMVGHESELKLGIKVSHSFYKEMNALLSQPGHGDDIAGVGSFTIADISLLCVLDFGAGPVKITPRWSELPALKLWHQRVTARPSVQTHYNVFVPKGRSMEYDDGDHTTQSSKL